MTHDTELIRAAKRASKAEATRFGHRVSRRWHKTGFGDAVAVCERCRATAARIRYALDGQSAEDIHDHTPCPCPPETA